jgi:hypothetical protein
MPKGKKSNAPPPPNKRKTRTRKHKKKSRQIHKLGGSSSSCSNFLDIKVANKINEIWETCIQSNRILYITPKNVLIKSIETIQIPEFCVNAGRNPIRIENKCVGCFLKVRGIWYAIMRLFGTTLNTGYFALTEKNKVFYK